MEHERIVSEQDRMDRVARLPVDWPLARARLITMRWISDVPSKIV